MIDPVKPGGLRGEAPGPGAAPPPRPAEFKNLLALLLQKPAAPGEGDQLGALLSDQLRLTILEALARRPELSPGAPAPPPGVFGATPRAGEPNESVPASGIVRPDEGDVITEFAREAGIDPDFLKSLRRVENGGPGREFGVLSIPAPTYHDQARVAAESVKRNLERFRREGGEPIDPATGRYTSGFIRFFSSRYAPIGASNDPRGLNRFHAGNLIRAYLKS